MNTPTTSTSESSRSEQHLLTPLDWSIEAHARAAKLTGTKEGEMYRRYVLMHEYIASVRDTIERVTNELHEMRTEVEANDRALVQAKAMNRQLLEEIEQLKEKTK